MTIKKTVFKIEIKKYLLYKGVFELKLSKKLSTLILVLFFFTGITFATDFEKETINIAILGYGTVGSGVNEVVNNNANNIERWSDKHVKVKKIFVRKTHTDLLNNSGIFTANFEEILNDPEIKIVVEAMCGLDPAYDFVKHCLESGKSVVTANKLLVATHGAELLKIAQENKVNLKFEASVGGGIPIIEPMMCSLSANNINKICGILNGTTNFILTKMRNENLSFEEALKMAQKLGYAEADPTADIEGLDARNKICILASIAYGIHVYPQDVYVQGISNISLADIKCAENLGYVIKLIAYAQKDGENKLSIFVSPMLVPKSNPLSIVDDVFNAVLIDGDCTGEIMFYGKGAGKFPTASAVVSDIISCIKNFDFPRKAYWEDNHSENLLNHCPGLNNGKCYFKVMENGIEKTFIAENISKKEMENSGIKLISSITVLE